MRNSTAALVDSLASMEPSPCEKFNCPARAECSTQLIACTAFRFYVQTGRSLDPHLVFPIKVTRLQQPEYRDTITPSREVYQSLSKEQDHEEEDAELNMFQEIVGALETRQKLEEVWFEPVEAT